MRIRKPKIVDMRGKLPVHASRKFGRRKASDVRGVVYHQVLLNATVTQVAAYHVSEESHISPGQGCPGICYTFFVDLDGTVYQCNDVEAITWSQGGKKAPPLPMTRSNSNFLAVVFRGDFSGKGHKGKDEPTEAQLDAARRLWHHLREEFGLSDSSQALVKLASLYLSGLEAGRRDAAA